MKLKDDYELALGDLTSATCGSGGCRDYAITYKGLVIKEGRTCACGRGCNGYDCVRDDWARHDTDIELYRAD